MNFLDFALAFCLLIFLADRRRMSAAYYTWSAAGFMGGYVVGLLLAPELMHFGSSDVARGTISLSCMFGGGLIGFMLARWPANKLRNRLIMSPVFKADKYLAWFIKPVLFLAVLIMFAQTLAYVPILGLQYLVQGSAVLYATDKYTSVPQLEASAQRIDPAHFSALHLDYDLQPITNTNIQAAAGPFQQAVDAEANSVVRVSGRSCVGLQFGSGFVASDGIVVTNAHVVAGSNSLYISDHHGSYPATPLLIDNGHDIAILYSKYLHNKPLPIVAKDAPLGTPAAIMGYPGAGDLVLTPALVQATDNLPAYNAKRTKLTFDDVFVLSKPVFKGNSGGPVLNLDGEVLGVVNAASNHDSIAIKASVINGLLVSARARNTPSRTGFCATFQWVY